jgi:hypothetical protein
MLLKCAKLWAAATADILATSTYAEEEIHLPSGTRMKPRVLE